MLLVQPAGAKGAERAASPGLEPQEEEGYGGILVGSLAATRHLHHNQSWTDRLDE